jgi:preprotein translocase subunit SecE
MNLKHQVHNNLLKKATRMIVVLSLVLGVAIGIMDVVLQKILVDGVARLAR